ncbi:MAG: hypothetical protein AMXMBFR36_23890 [Acidobacteriota bacterium]
MRQSDRLDFARRFLQMFLPVALSLAAIYLVMSRLDRRQIEESFESGQEGRLELAREIFASQFRRLGSDVLFLAELAGAGGDETVEPAESIDGFGRRLATFLAKRGVYGEARRIDPDGRELIVLRAAAGSVESAADSELGRLEPEATLELCRQAGAGRVTFSFEVAPSVAGGAASVGEPLLRVCAPVSGDSGSERGAILLDYRARHLLDRLVADEHHFPDRLAVADSRGRWIRAPADADPALSAGTRVGEWSPELAAAIDRESAGSVRWSRGLLRFVRFDPVAAVRQTISGPPIEARAGDSWTLVSYIPESVARAPFDTNRRVALGVFAALLLATAAMAVQTARLGVSRSREAMRRTRELDFYQRIADALPLPVYVRGHDGRYLAANRAGCELVGVAPEALIGRQPQEIFALEDFAPVFEADRDVEQGVTQQTFDVRLVTAAGLRDIVVHRSILLGPDGERRGTVSSLVDVTDMRRMQRRVAESEERFRALVENSLDITGIVDAEGTFSYVSPSVELILGWRPAEVVGRRIFDFVQPEDLRRLSEAFAANVRRPGASPRFHFRFRSRSGSFRTLEAIANNLMDETLVRAMFVFARDVTDAVEAQARVEESRRALEAVVDEMPVLFAALDEEFNPLVWNRECERVLGFERSEMLGHDDAFARVVPDDSTRLRFRERFARTGGDFRNWEMEMATKGGETRIVSWSSVSKRAPISGWFVWAIGADVTGQRLAERERARATLALETWSQRLMTLSQLDDVLLACATLEEAYAATGPFLRTLLPADTGVLYRFVPGESSGEPVVRWGTGAAAEGTVAVRDCWGIRLSRPYAYGPESPEPRCPHLAEHFAGRSLCVPVQARDELIGLIHLRFPLVDSGDSEFASASRMASSVASHLAIRYSAISLRELLSHQSTRDPLTNLFNRRYLEDTIARELERCRRSGKSLAVLALDLDHFKRVNDEHGHDAGDEVLRATADVLRRQSRASDVACRAGGEEFVMLMPEVEPKVAAERAEAIRAEIAGMGTRRPEPAFGRLTTSIGVAVFPDVGKDARSLLRAADRALYRAKEAGRDRVVMARSLDETLGG